MRSTAMRFSVPSSWLCRVRKFWLDLRSGYFSTVTSSRLRAPPSSDWACWNFWNAAGSLISSGVTLMPATLARALVTSSSTVRSCAA